MILANISFLDAPWSKVDTEWNSLNLQSSLALLEDEISTVNQSLLRLVAFRPCSSDAGSLEG